MASNPQEPYKGPILIQCSACSAGDHEMKYHDHEWVPVWNRAASPLPAEPPPTANYMQQLPGGNCFAHGPYPGTQCPKWPACATDPQSPEFRNMPTAVWRAKTEAMRTPSAADPQKEREHCNQCGAPILREGEHHAVMHPSIKAPLIDYVEEP